MVDVNDAFDEIFLFEEKIRKESYEEGIDVGKQRGLSDGFNLGFKKGKEIGSELGFYRGCVECWLKLNVESKMELKTRTRKVLETLLQSLERFPSTNIENEDMLKDLNDIRSKFKQVLSLMDIPSDISTKDVSF